MVSCCVVSHVLWHLRVLVAKVRLIPVDHTMKLEPRLFLDAFDVRPEQVYSLATYLEMFIMILFYAYAVLATVLG